MQARALAGWMDMKMGHIVAQWKLSAAVVHVYRGQVPQPHYFGPHGLFLWETGKWTPISSPPAAAPYLCG